MAGNNRQKKPSSFLSAFGLFKSRKGRGGYHEFYNKVTRDWPSDEDRGCWGVAEPGIDRKAEDFIAQCRKRIFECELIQLDDPAAAATVEQE